VSSLVDKDGFLHSKVSRRLILNDQFHSVYTTEDHNNFSEKGRSQYPTMDRIKVHCNGVLKLLKNLKVHKATLDQMIYRHTTSWKIKRYLKITSTGS
jgi:transcription termination factor NusB